MQGDYLYCARNNFRHLTPEQMQKTFGRNRETRAQVLAGHEEARHNKIQAAIDWVKAQPTSNTLPTDAARKALVALQNLFGVEGAVAVWRLGGSDEVRTAMKALSVALDEPTFSPGRAKSVLPHADNLPPQGNTGG